MKKGVNTFSVIYKKAKGGYTAWVEEMPGVISEGKTKKETERNIKDALSFMLETNRIMSLKDAIGDIERATIKLPVQTV